MSLGLTAAVTDAPPQCRHLEGEKERERERERKPLRARRHSHFPIQPCLPIRLIIFDSFIYVLACFCLSVSLAATCIFFPFYHLTNGNSIKMNLTRDRKGTNHQPCSNLFRHNRDIFDGEGLQENMKTNF